ncbi:MAG: hypothetical protein WC915_05325 [archaeon]|jgi:hypothetical protein
MDTKEKILKENERLAKLKLSDQMKRWDKEGVNQYNQNSMESARKN